MLTLFSSDVCMWNIMENFIPHYISPLIFILLLFHLIFQDSSSFIESICEVPSFWSLIHSVSVCMCVCVWTSPNLSIFVSLFPFCPPSSIFLSPCAPALFCQYFLIRSLRMSFLSLNSFAFVGVCS